MSWISQVGQCNNKTPYQREAGGPIKDEEMMTETEVMLVQALRNVGVL